LTTFFRDKNSEKYIRLFLK